MNPVLFQFIILLVGSFATGSYAAGSYVSTAQGEALDPIKRANQLTLDRERMKASEVLRAAIEKELKEDREDSANEDNLNNYKKALKRVGRIFYGQNAQKEFELAESLYFAQKPGSLSHYEQAHRLEPGNIQILLGLMRDHLSRGDCRRALDAYTQVVEINPFDEEGRYFQWLAKLCSERGGAPKIDKDLLSHHEIGPYAQTQRLLWQVLNEETLDKEDVLKIQERLKDFPEPYYYLHQIEKKEEEIISLEFAKRYIEICRRMGSGERRQFRLFPRVCQHREALELETRAMEQNE